MLKKTRTKRPSFFLIVIMILLSCIILENVTAKLPVELYYGESFTWVINDISEGNNQWYNVSDFLSFENWHANQSNVVSFTVYSSEEINNKEYLTGNLEIGNLTVETHDQEIAFNLILSAFTWYGGLVSLEENWDDLIYTTPFNGSSTQVTYDVLTNILDREVDAIRINYDEFGQVTELLYEPITGILLSANTTFSSYSLGMKLASSSIPIPSKTSSFPALTIVSGFLVIGFFSIIWRRKRKY